MEKKKMALLDINDKTQGTVEERINQTKEEEVDRISELHDSVLFHIMKFMDTYPAIQTCVLSKRWKNVCKQLTDIRFDCSSSRTWLQHYFENFESWVLFHRDDFCPLLNLVIKVDFFIHPLCMKKLDNIVKYALFHNVQILEIHTIPTLKYIFESLPSIFCSRTLTSLTLVNPSPSGMMFMFPVSLHMPALKTLVLIGACFTPSDDNHNHCVVEPFSKCNMLTTLTLECFYLHENAVLSISNSSLSSLKLCDAVGVTQEFEIELSTPNLNCCTIDGFGSQLISTKGNLPFLEVVNIYDRRWMRTTPIIIQWLQGFGNVKTLTLTTYDIEIIFCEISDPTTIKDEPPCFVRLELLKVIISNFALMPHADVITVLEYLLQNSPKTKVNIYYLQKTSIY